MKIKLGNNEYNHIYMILIAYWLILLFWQNYGGAFNHSSIDIVIKIILIMSLSIYYFLHSKTVLKINVFSFISFAFCILISFFNDSNATGEIIDYLYPVLFIFISLVLGNRFQIAHNDFLILCRIIIFTNLYMCIYAVLFCREQFISAFSISQAYGNELKSFLYSNHEYGLYLLLSGSYTSCRLLHYST